MDTMNASDGIDDPKIPEFILDMVLKAIDEVRQEVTKDDNGNLPDPYSNLVTQVEDEVTKIYDKLKESEEQKDSKNFKDLFKQAKQVQVKLCQNKLLNGYLLKEFWNRASPGFGPMSEKYGNFTELEMAELFKIGDQEELKQQCDTLKSKYEQLKSNDDSKREAFNNTYTYTYSQLNALHKDTIGVTRDFNSNGRLDLHLHKSHNRTFLSSLRKSIPNLDSVNLYKVPDKNITVKNFLESHFPEKMREFWFENISDIAGFEYYFSTLLPISKSVTESYGLRGFALSSDQLVSLFSACKHINTLKLHYCNLCLEEPPEFGQDLAGCKIEKIKLWKSGGPTCGDWANNPHHFENLICAISENRDLKKNLKEISVGF